MVRPTTNIGKCSEPTCNSLATKIGMCQKHYYRLRTNGNTNKLQRNQNYKDTDKCVIRECGNIPRSKNLCNKHYADYLRFKNKNKNSNVSDYIKVKQ